MRLVDTQGALVGFGNDLPGDDPIGDGYLDDPTEDLSLPVADPWGVEPRDLQDGDFDPDLKSGRAGRENMKLLEGGFGFEAEMFSGFGPARSSAARAVSALPRSEASRA